MGLRVKQRSLRTCLLDWHAGFGDGLFIPLGLSFSLNSLVLRMDGEWLIGFGFWPRCSRALQCSLFVKTQVAVLENFVNGCYREPS